MHKKSKQKDVAQLSSSVRCSSVDSFVNLHRFYDSGYFLSDCLEDRKFVQFKQMKVENRDEVTSGLSLHNLSVNSYGNY